MLDELIQKLQNEHGITAEQSHGVINTVLGFIKQKFPMAGGMLDNLVPTGSNTSQSNNQDAPQGPRVNESTLGKLEDWAKSKLGNSL